MQVYVINLDRDRDRLAHTREQLAGVPFTRIPAVEGATIAEPANGLTRFEVACLLSHREAWRRFLATSEPCACFIEDDLHVWPGLAALATDGAWVPPDAHAVKLDTYFQLVRLGPRRPAVAGREVARLYSRHESSAAYLLTRAGAERYLALTDPPTLPADYSIFPRNPRKLGLVIYQLVPAVAIQDHLKPAAEGGQRFVTAMNAGAPPGKRRRSPLAKLAREVARFAAQADDAREVLRLRTTVRTETAVVPVG